MHTLLLAVGKLRPSFRAACDDYLRRIRRYGPIEEREVRESGRVREPATRRREESARLERLIPERAHPVVLDRGGSSWTTEQLAARLEKWRGTPLPVCLVIGGAFGLDPGFSGDRAGVARWSLGPLTLPHELARVVVLEQWYRAWTILRGEAYHK